MEVILISREGTLSDAVDFYRYEERKVFCGHLKLPELEMFTFHLYNPTDFIP